MDCNRIDLLLELVPQDVMNRFFRCKKTVISSCVDDVFTFLNQLHDHDLISENLYQEVIKAKYKDRKEKGVYKILKYVEMQGGKSIKKFWRCVFEDHMLQKYSFLNPLFISLLEEHIRFHGRLPDAKKPTENEEKKSEQKQGQNKRKKSADETDKEEPNTSSMSRSSQTNASMVLCFSRPIKKEEEEDIWPLDSYTTEVPVTCGDKEDILHRDKRVRGSCNKSVCTVKPSKTAEKKKGEIKTEKIKDKEPRPFSVSSCSKEKPATNPTACLPVKKEKKEDIWTLDCYKTDLPVTCGDQEGILHRDKFFRAEKCILSQGCWFTPNEFEIFSGKGNSKKWKQTICCQNTPLQKLIEEGHLRCARTFRACSHKQKTAFSSSGVESSSPQSASSIDTDESSEDLGEWIKKEDSKEEEDDEEYSEPVDLSKFQAFSLPVFTSCGSVRGVLYKSRFAGSRSKSIRTEERWFTPEEFIQQELTLTDGHWKTDILCHGKTLHYLVKKKILHIHSLLCPCRLCCPENKRDQDNDDVCHICNSAGNLVCCDECPRAFHPDCHLPALQEEETEDKWICTFCVVKTNQGFWIKMNMKDILQRPVSGTVMQCQYLLMRLYKEDTKRVFIEDPTTSVKRYSSVISKPMWLDRVKTKLQNAEYKTMAGFVCDIILIYNNCKTFNKDNAFGRMGDNLKKIFVQDFYTIFKIQ